MSKIKNSSENLPVAETAKPAAKVDSATPDPKSKEIHAALVGLGVQLDDSRVEALVKQTAAKVKERGERARKREEEKAWRDELSPSSLVVALSEMLLSGKRRGPKPKGSTNEASTSGEPSPASSSLSEGAPTSPPAGEAKVSLDEFKLVERDQW